MMGLRTGVFGDGDGAGSSLEQPTHNKKSANEMEIIVAKTFITSS